MKLLKSLGIKSEFFPLIPYKAKAKSEQTKRMQTSLQLTSTWENLKALKREFCLIINKKRELNPDNKSRESKKISMEE